MLRNLSFVMLLSIVFVITGCDKISNISNPQTPPITSVDLQILKNKIALLENKLFLLQLQLATMNDMPAIVTTEDNGYSIANTKFGPFLVTANKVVPYLDGYKITLTIGNMTNAVFDGSKINVSWGEKFEQSKEVDVTNSFYPGYTKVEFAVTPAKPDEVKALRVKLDFNIVRLHK